jgi:small subunit ribosomal protein S1
MFKIVDEKLDMEDLMANQEGVLLKPELGSVIKGNVIGLRKNHITVDLNGLAVGVIAGAEAQDSAGTVKDLKVGDEVSAVVVEQENDDGMVVLSLRKASQANAWERFEKAFKDGDILEVTATEANKGGLLLDIDGIKGFIPVSQLAPLHYPRVDNSDANLILVRLKRLIGTRFNVKVINVDRETGKMILSEKAALEDASESALKQLKVGDVVKGKVSGVVKFGIFVTFHGLEGLVHIAEIAWGHVSDPHQFAMVGDEMEVAIIGIEKNKLSLSVKRLTPDPWEAIAGKYPMDSKVKGKVIRFSQFGAFVQLEDDLNGLIHVSEISDQKVEDPREALNVGDVVEAVVVNIDRDEHRLKESRGGRIVKKAPSKPVKNEKLEDVVEELKNVDVEAEVKKEVAGEPEKEEPVESEAAPEEPKKEEAPALENAPAEPEEEEQATSESEAEEKEEEEKSE